MDKLPRPVVSSERYRELEILAMQIMCQLPHTNLGEVLIVRDLCENILRRWLVNERMITHEAVLKAVSEMETNVIRLPLSD